MSHPTQMYFLLIWCVGVRKSLGVQEITVEKKEEKTAGEEEEKPEKWVRLFVCRGKYDVVPAEEIKAQ